MYTPSSIIDVRRDPWLGEQNHFQAFSVLNKNTWLLGLKQDGSMVRLSHNRSINAHLKTFPAMDNARIDTPEFKAFDALSRALCFKWAVHEASTRQYKKLEHDESFAIIGLKSADTFTPSIRVKRTDKSISKKAYSWTRINPDKPGTITCNMEPVLSEVLLTTADAERLINAARQASCTTPAQQDTLDDYLRACFGIHRSLLQLISILGPKAQYQLFDENTGQAQVRHAEGRWVFSLTGADLITLTYTPKDGSEVVLEDLSSIPQTTFIGLNAVIPTAISYSELDQAVWQSVITHKPALAKR